MNQIDSRTMHKIHFKKDSTWIMKNQQKKRNRKSSFENEEEEVEM